MWDEASELYPLLGAEANKSSMTWFFDTGSNVTFAHLGSGEEVKWQGAQITMIGYDQLEHWPEGQFFYMLSRNRSTCGIKPYIRATCNPDADSWLAKFLAWWINQETGLPIYERAGVVRWMLRVNGELVWGNSYAELKARYPGKEYIPKSVTFIPSKVYDNKILLEKNPEYLSNLMALPTVDRERLLNGNWKIRPEAGKVFNRAWVDIVPFAPAGGLECRRWDFAATEKKVRKADPDFTAGVKIRRVNGEYFVLDCVAEQAGPADVDRLFDEVTRLDLEAVATDHALTGGADGRDEDGMRKGVDYMVRWEVEPGSAGVRESARLVQKLAGIDAAGVRSSGGDKLLRGRPFCQMAQLGHVHLVAGPWNESWLAHMHNQPEIMHDDIWDATAGAYRDLTLGMIERPDADAGEDLPGAGRAVHAGRGPKAAIAARAAASLRGKL